MLDSREVRFLKRRGRLDIYLDILSSIHRLGGMGWARTTRVMYIVNLNPRSLKEKLQELSYLDMIVWNEHGVRLTEKGYSFLKEMRAVLEKYEVLSIRSS
jgi:predicted transcriptional regulator